MSSKALLKEKIILPALELIKNDNKIKKYYFVPGLLSIILLSVILVYQSIYTYVIILWKKREALQLVLDFFHSTYIIEAIIVAVIFMLVYIVAMPILEWWLIKYIHDRDVKWEASFGDSIGFWVYRFYPLFEFSNIFNQFQFINILNGYLFALRFIGLEYVKYISYVFIIIYLFSIVMNTIIAYAKYEIVLWDKSMFPAIWASSKIALINIRTTMKLYFLMFIVNIKVILNFVIFLSFPVLFGMAFLFITSQIFLVITLIILGIIFIGLIIVLWYITAVLEVFTTAIWYFAFREWRKKLIEAENNN